MVTKVIKLMYSEIRGLHQAAYILAFFALGSQMLALVRDRLLAHSFGAGAELDLYYAAFRIPDLLFVLFASVLSIYVLLPFVTKAREESGSAAGAAVLGQMFTVFLLGYAAVAFFIFMFTPQLITIFFPGLTGDTHVLTILIRVLLLQPFFLGLSSLFGIVTQLAQRFVIYAISPLVYNLGIIFGIIVLYPRFGMIGLVEGVVIGAVGHLLVQWPLVRQSDLRFSFVRQIDYKLLRSIFLVAVPRALTLSVHQLVLLVFIGVATMMASGSVSVFQFAFNLQSVPLAIIGMSYSVATFPILADHFAKKQNGAFNDYVLSALRHIIFWSLPITALVIVLRAQIVRVVLGSGAFDWSDTKLTAAVLALFIIGLTAQSTLLLIVRTFYAGGRTKIPLMVAGIGATVSIIFAFVSLTVLDLYPEFKHLFEVTFRLTGVVGTEVLVLAFAFVLGVIIETGILLYLLKSIFGLKLSSIKRQGFESLLAALVGALFTYGTLVFVVDGINQDTFKGIMLQGLIAGVVGVIACGFTYYLLGSKELREIYISFHSRLRKNRLIAPQSDLT